MYCSNSAIILSLFAGVFFLLYYSMCVTSPPQYQDVNRTRLCRYSSVFFFSISIFGTGARLLTYCNNEEDENVPILPIAMVDEREMQRMEPIEMEMSPPPPYSNV